MDCIDGDAIKRAEGAGADSLEPACTAVERVLAALLPPLVVKSIRQILHGRIERPCRIIVHDPSMGALRDMDACENSPRLTAKSSANPSSSGYEYRFLKMAVLSAGRGISFPCKTLTAPPLLSSPGKGRSGDSQFLSCLNNGYASKPPIRSQFLEALWHRNTLAPKTDAPPFGSGNALCLPLAEELPFRLCHIAEQLEHNIRD